LIVTWSHGSLNCRHHLSAQPGPRFIELGGVSYRNAEFLHNEVPGERGTPAIMERMRAASAISKEAGRDEGLKIARESLLEVREHIQGVQVSAPFGNVKYALEVFEVLEGFGRQTSLVS